MEPRRKIMILLSAALLAAVTLAYANHFNNPFHFDDSHAVVDNPYIRSLRNAPLFFTDAQTFSNLPANRSYRPLISLSLAFDYWLGGGLKPAYFQASTFLWFLVQLALMYALFRKLGVTDLVALLAVALYGLHPAMAETVNYVIQRGDLYSTLGVIASLVIYASAPKWRTAGFYLLPLAAALLSKPPALVFPAILFAYIYLFETQKLSQALRRCIPALVTTCALGVLISVMTPKTYAPGAVSATDYRLTQPLVAFHYFRTFFLPDRLSADSDMTPVHGLFDNYAWLGFLFVCALAILAGWCSKHRTWRPAAFGLWWFLLALVPTSIFPLAEVENDHRMFFPFVGLALAVCSAGAVWLSRIEPIGIRGRLAVTAGCLTLIAALVVGTRERNAVWQSDESLWLDVTLKSPLNGRGLMNYGLTQMSKGQTARALEYFERALPLTPAYSVLEINLGIAHGLLNHREEADRHFLRALALAPGEAISHFFYARWLRQLGRGPEAIHHLQLAVAVNPDYLPARYLLLETLAQHSEWGQVTAVAADTMKRFPSDPASSGYLVRAKTAATQPAPARGAEEYLTLSMTDHSAGKYRESIAAAKQALRLRPAYPEAYNNLAASYEAMGMWDEAIDAARQAIALKPDFQLARNNLRWSEDQRRLAQRPAKITAAALARRD